MSSKIFNDTWNNVNDFETLREIKFTALGPKHTPVPHYNAIMFFREQLAEHNIEIIKESAIISPDSMRLIYVADVKSLDGIEHKDFNFSVGFINHNDRSKSFTGLAGTRVYANNAGMFITEDSFRTKHMQNVMSYLNERSASIIQWFKQYYNTQSGRIEQMKQIKCTDEMLGAVLLHYIRHPYVLSSTNIKRIVGSFDKPVCREFTDKSLWSLQNTTAEVFKRIKSPLAKLEAMETFEEAIEKFLPEQQTVEVFSSPEENIITALEAV